MHTYILTITTTTDTHKFVVSAVSVTQAKRKTEQLVQQIITTRIVKRRAVML